MLRVNETQCAPWTNKNSTPLALGNNHQATTFKSLINYYNFAWSRSALPVLKGNSAIYSDRFLALFLFDSGPRWRCVKETFEIFFPVSCHPLAASRVGWNWILSCLSKRINSLLAKFGDRLIRDTNLHVPTSEWIIFICQRTLQTYKRKTNRRSLSLIASTRTDIANLLKGWSIDSHAHAAWNLTTSPKLMLWTFANET